MHMETKMSATIEKPIILKQILLAAAGVVLYVPAAIGLGIAELLRSRRDDDAAWRFTLPGLDYETRHLAPTGKGGLWSHMRLKDYFSMIPGSAAVSHRRCIIDRSLAVC